MRRPYRALLVGVAAFVATTLAILIAHVPGATPFLA